MFTAAAIVAVIIVFGYCDQYGMPMWASIVLALTASFIINLAESFYYNPPKPKE